MKKLLLLAYLLCLSCDLLDGKYDVEYKVSGTTNSVDMTYENKGGGTSQESQVVPPWYYKFEGKKDDFVYISAQNNNSSGSVTVAIYVDGDKFKSSTSNGAYVIATASGSL